MASMISIEERINKEVSRLLPKIITKRFEVEVDGIREVIMETFDELLVQEAEGIENISNPENLIDAFVAALDNFDFIEEGEELTLKTPEHEDFDFSGELTSLAIIVEGIPGEFHEISEQDLQSVLAFGNLAPGLKTKLEALPAMFDDTTSEHLRYRLVPSEPTLISTLENMLNKKLSVFPFSNFEPIELFEAAKKYTKENAQKWVKESVDKAIKMVSQRYK
jgi:hypothetical protein